MQRSGETQYEHSSLFPTHITALYKLSDCQLLVREVWSSRNLYPPHHILVVTFSIYSIYAEFQADTTWNSIILSDGRSG